MTLRSYSLARLGTLAPVLLAVSLLTFGLSSLSPGDPAAAKLFAQGQEPTAEATALLREQLGLDQPFPVRYLHWLGRMLQGDLGISYTSGQPVLTELLQRLPATLCLAGLALSLSLILTVPAGLLGARYPHSLFDHIARGAALVNSSVPVFWLGLILLFYFGVRLRWLPVAGDGDLRHLALPALTLALALSAT